MSGKKPTLVLKFGGKVLRRVPWENWSTDPRSKSASGARKVTWSKNFFKLKKKKKTDRVNLPTSPSPSLPILAVSSPPRTSTPVNNMKRKKTVRLDLLTSPSPSSLSPAISSASCATSSQKTMKQPRDLHSFPQSVPDLIPKPMQPPVAKIKRTNFWIHKPSPCIQKVNQKYNFSILSEEEKKKRRMEREKAKEEKKEQLKVEEERREAEKREAEKMRMEKMEAERRAEKNQGIHLLLGAEVPGLDYDDLRFKIERRYSEWDADRQYERELYEKEKAEERKRAMMQNEANRYGRTVANHLRNVKLFDEIQAKKKEEEERQKKEEEERKKKKDEERQKRVAEANRLWEIENPALPESHDKSCSSDNY